MNVHQHPNAERITRDFEAWAEAADQGRTIPRDIERERMEIEARRRSPLRTTQPQEDAGHLPLFVAANEPTLF